MTDPDPAAPAPGGVGFTRAGFRRGVRAALAIAIGLAPFGLVIGMVSDSRGLSLVEALVMSGLVFAGFVFWCFCFGMSRYSAYMERRLDTGHRK